MSILTRAYARGVADTLLRTGHLKVASVNVAEHIADFVGDHILFDPVQKVATAHAAEVAAAILKVAVDEGTLITGGDPSQQNTPENADSMVGGLAALDESDRPEGTYHLGQGVTDMPAPMVGAEVSQKSAALQRLIRKLAMDEGTLITGGDPAQSNTPENAAAYVGGLAALDQAVRPEGMYLVGQGATDMPVPSDAVIGSEMVHPMAPMTTGEGAVSNSVIDATKAAGYKSSAYARLFEETARKVAKYLPKSLSNTQKVASIKRMMVMSDEEQITYLTSLKHAEDKEEEEKKMEEMVAEEAPQESSEEEEKEEEEKTAAMNVSNLLSEIATLAQLAGKKRR